MRLLAVALLAGLGIALAVVLSPQAHAQGEDLAELSVDCEGNTADIDATCSFGVDQEFGVSVHIEHSLGEYSGAQIKLFWDPDVVDYLPTADPSDEVVWSGCTLPLRRDNHPEEPSVLFGCLNFTGQQDEPVILTDYQGPLVLFGLQCIAEGTSELYLASAQGDAQLGSQVYNDVGFALNPTLTVAMVTCSGAEVTRPAQEVTPAEITPLPTAEATEPIPTDEEGNPIVQSSRDGDDDGTPAWVWILVVAGGVVAFAMAAVVIWVRARPSQ